MALILFNVTRLHNLYINSLFYYIYQKINWLNYKGTLQNYTTFKY